ncbi:TetR/AcrR family transcriptional regulator, transcriptional repressor for nem operon [Amycolatopsis xylanica]|uniref:TetR/AcrR family transcriptional regulator, transcriptional repressor for nem operon n=1 Tax=Amycolatopsis xylanica TaxID=589385 RepID=A0A1H2TKZ8_9PSEU|nr:TetR/AcrR family transcriptional regulator [Amycolatopsis xylanica]SDW44581.1 TetR/AcrR family transcriptional regulator, transcriptional repressor for nem operon [Amycolatopsis xylanica]
MARASLREQIVDAAYEQFHQHGYHGCGVKLITDSAGVPKGSFYNHFESKEALALVVMERYGDTRRVPDLVNRDAAEPLARLRAHFEFLASDIEKHGYRRGCVFGNFANEAADHSPVIRAGLVAAFDSWSEAVVSAIREAQADGSITSTQDPEVLGRFLVNAWEGAIVGERAAKDGSSFAAFFAVAFDTLLR